MAKEELEHKTTEELQKMASAFKAMTFILAFVLLLLLGLSSYLVFILEKTGMIALLMMPFALSPILLMNFNKMRKYQKEVQKRKK